jgi:hypothetical protein
MIKTTLLPAIVTALAALSTPTPADAYGACHVGYTHVGPNGVYHSGETVARGPEGNVYAGGHTSAYGAGGASYHAGYGTEYHYSPTYSAGAEHYAYIR